VHEVDTAVGCWFAFYQ